MATDTVSPNGPAQTAEATVLTLSEAAAFLRVSEEGLTKDADAGLLPGRLVGGEWRFVKAALLNWLATAAGGRSSPPADEGRSSDVICKAVPPPRDLNKGFLDSIGAFAGDPTLEPMVEKIYRDRKRTPLEE